MSDEFPHTSADSEVLDFVSRVTGSVALSIEENLSHGFVRLKVAEAERRQALHDIRDVEDIVAELARNARDAGARSILVAIGKERGRYRKLAVLDDGCGIPGDMHQLVFEPRVTSKREEFVVDRYGVHGRGMALFSIRMRAGDARVVASEPGVGTSVALTVDTCEVPERSDQATFPTIRMGDGEPALSGGPHNIPRVLLEMSLDSPGIDFYLGSFSEVLATVVWLGRSQGTRKCLWSAASQSADGRALASAAEGLGLKVSERNAYRVLAGEIKPLEPVIKLARQVESEGRSDGTVPLAPALTDRGTARLLKRVSSEDLARIGEGAEGVARKVLEKYYMIPRGPVRVRKARSRIVITINVAEEEE